MPHKTTKIITEISKTITEDPNIYCENPLIGAAIRTGATALTTKTLNNPDPDSTDDNEINAIETDLTETHHYLRRTSKSLEKKLRHADEKAHKASGHENFELINQHRNKILNNIEKKRPLRRFEYIKKYGYDAWLDYIKQHNLPETHKWADK